MTKVVNHETKEACTEALKEQVQAVTSSGRPWMGVLFHVDSKGYMRLDRTSCEFPTHRFGECADLLVECLREGAAQAAGLSALPKGDLNELFLQSEEGCSGVDP